MKKHKEKSKASSSSLDSSCISTASLQIAIDKFSRDQNWDSTKRNYFTIWRLFNKFCVRLDEKPLNWEDRIILFTGHLVESGKKSSTVKSYISAIRAVLRDINISISEDKYIYSRPPSKPANLRMITLSFDCPFEKNCCTLCYNRWTRCSYLRINSPTLRSYIGQCFPLLTMGCSGLGRSQRVHTPYWLKMYMWALINKKCCSYFIRQKHTGKMSNHNR